LNGTDSRPDTASARTRDRRLAPSDWMALLTIEDHFAVAGHGLVLTPDFTAPVSGSWVNFCDKVFIEPPDGIGEEFHCFFMLVSLALSGTGSMAQKQRVILLLPEGTKAAAPRGSTVWVPRDVQRKLIPFLPSCSSSDRPVPALI